MQQVAAPLVHQVGQLNLFVDVGKEYGILVIGYVCGQGRQLWIPSFEHLFERVGLDSGSGQTGQGHLGCCCLNGFFKCSPLDRALRGVAEQLQLQGFLDGSGPGEDAVEVGRLAPEAGGCLAQIRSHPEARSNGQVPVMGIGVLIMRIGAVQGCLLLARPLLAHLRIRNIALRDAEGDAHQRFERVAGSAALDSQPNRSGLGKAAGDDHLALRRH